MHRRQYLASVAGSAVATLTGCAGVGEWFPGGTPAIDAPSSAMVDEPLAVTVPEPTSAEVWVEARTRDGAGRSWFSRVEFETDDGRIRVPDARPTRGTYDEPSGMGLFWSMQPDAINVHRYDPGQRVQTVDLRVLPEATDADPVAETTIERRFIPPQSTEREVEDPIVGTLVESPSEGPAPGVILFHGSAGNRPLAEARVLASHGFTVLALQYFSPDYDRIPDALVEVPVEYADRAVDWLADHDAVSDAPIGLGGFSRGGELALLVGTRHENVGTVVNWVGAGILFNAVILTADGHVSPQSPDTSAWTIDGDPLAYPSRDDYTRGGNLTQRYREWLDETPDHVIDDATIPLEELNGPVLLISGGSDGIWPSRYLLNRAEARLEELDYPHRFEHLTYDAAGHGISVPYLPTWPNQPSRLLGGTIAGTAAAEADAWPRAIEYFERGAKQ